MVGDKLNVLKMGPLFERRSDRMSSGLCKLKQIDVFDRDVENR